MQVDMHAHAHTFTQTFTHTWTPPSAGSGSGGFSRGNRGRARKVPQVHAYSVTSTRADSDAIFVVERQIIGPGPAALGHGGIDALFVTLSVHAHEHVPHGLHLAVQHRHLRQTTSRSARDDTHKRDAQEGRTLRRVHTLCTPPHGPGSGTGAAAETWRFSSTCFCDSGLLPRPPMLSPRAARKKSAPSTAPPPAPVSPLRTLTRSFVFVPVRFVPGFYPPSQTSGPFDGS
jgi:hypothetical protein